MDYILFKTDMMDKGKEIGNKIGREESRLEIAGNAFKMGLSAEQTSQLTGLPLEQVEALRR